MNVKPTEEIEHASCEKATSKQLRATSSRQIIQGTRIRSPEIPKNPQTTRRPRVQIQSRIWGDIFPDREIYKTYCRLRHQSARSLVPFVSIQYSHQLKLIYRQLLILKAFLPPHPLSRGVQNYIKGKIITVDRRNRNRTEPMCRKIISTLCSPYNESRLNSETEKRSRNGTGLSEDGKEWNDEADWEGERGGGMTCQRNPRHKRHPIEN